jgi:hypothetical protein
VDPLGTIPLFPAAAGKPPKGPRAAQETAAKPVRPIGHAKCPRCSRGRAAVVQGGSHAIWKPHDYRTWSGAPLPCAASGVALCALPAKLEPGSAPLGCSH